MNILCVYVDGGKGHYIPAKAVQEQLEALGHNAVMVDFFEFLGLRLAGRINKFVWRRLLEHPGYEMKFSKRNDQNTDEIRLVSRLLRVIRMRRFRKMVNRYRPDMIFTTHPYPGYFLAELAHHGRIDVPVTYYATDVFSVPMSAICNHLWAMYVSTQEGYESALERGQRKDTLKLCPFPLQASCRESRRMSKKEARRLLGLDEDVFTLQVNFGGEGVGATDLLAALKDIDTPMQVLVIGGIEDRMKTELERIVRTLPENIDVRIVGFVANVNDYLLSCDIIAGRSGINTLVEAFYLRRPFLITELVYTVIASASYVEKYKVGWNASHDVARQLEIIRTYLSNPALLDEMDHNFDLIPMEYDASALAKMVVDDAQSYRTKTRTHG